MAQPKENNAEAELLNLWRIDAEEFSPWWARRVFRPRLVVKRGRCSPWFAPKLWLSSTGAFSMFWILIVSDTLLDCEPRYRRAILAHEMGHVAGWHSLLWVILIAGLLQIPFPELAQVVRHSYGPWGPMTALSLFMVLGSIWIGTVLVWFEHEADDYGARCVGVTDLMDAVRWLDRRLSGEEGSSWARERLARLESRVPGASRLSS